MTAHRDVTGMMADGNWIWGIIRPHGRKFQPRSVGELFEFSQISYVNIHTISRIIGNY